MEKINRLVKLFDQFNIDAYIIPKNDEFFNEYISENNDKLKFISNFSGSFGLALISKKKNYLFVDGRYTLQAKVQSGKLFEINTVPKSLPSTILKNKKLIIGFDPKLHTRKNLNYFFLKTKCKLLPVRENLIDKIWKNKKKEKAKKFYVMPKKDVGKSYLFKISLLTKKLKEKKIDFQFISSGENIAWLLNIRGNDSKYSPLINAYLTISLDKKINFFCDLKKIGHSFKKKFSNISFIDIKFLNQNLLEIIGKKVMIDESTCSIYFEKILKQNNNIVNSVDPIYFLKSTKSEIELRNTIKSHINDGAALTKFLFWLKKNYKKKKIDEITAEEKLLRFRKENRNFKSLSFPTISGSGPNGAIIHYRATKKTNRKLRDGDIYLVDSGGQYKFGTTDVTRTISLNNKNLRIKNIFTRVLKGHIAVATYKIKKNTQGSQIDKVARKFLNQIDLDYAHGTGHGVGYFLNVHEGPQAISKKNKIYLKQGMILSNEPGYYEKGKFGIRIENLIFVKKYKNNLYFENLTLAPIDKTLINKKILTSKEISWINRYHKKVFKNLKKFMSKIDLINLKVACSNI